MPSVHVGVTYSYFYSFHVGVTYAIVSAYEEHSSCYRGPGSVLVYHFSPRVLSSALVRSASRGAGYLGLLSRQRSAALVRVSCPPGAWPGRAVPGLSFSPLILVRVSGAGVL